MERWQLTQRQSLPREAKEMHTDRIIVEWYEHWDGMVYASVSGGLDSLVMLHRIRFRYPDVPAVYFDTGLEYPELRRFVLDTIDNLVVMRPQMTFNKIIEKYGYPIISKEQARYIYQARTTKSEKLRHKCLHGKLGRDGKTVFGKIADKWQYLINAPFKISEQCCHVMKKQPAARYERQTGRKAFIGMRAEEGWNRTSTYLERGGCNAFSEDRPISWPLGIWTHQDILTYVIDNNLPYCKEIYGDIVPVNYPLFGSSEYKTTGEERTGCMFCMFGVHLDGAENRFTRMERTHPKIHDYCINQLGLGKVLDYIGVKHSKGA